MFSIFRPNPKHQLLTGIILMILGILVLIDPAVVILYISWILSIFVLLVGIQTLYVAIKFKDKETRSLVTGIIITILGIALIINIATVGNVVGLIIYILIAVVFLFYAIATLQYHLSHKRKYKKNQFLIYMIVDILAVAIGVVLLISPAITLTFASLVLGITLLVFGIKFIMTAR